MAAHLTFILGGAASGKSALAETVIRDSGFPRVYIATAQAFDAEMKEKIARHQKDRGPDWTTIEAPLALGEAIARVPARVPADHILLIDCLTLWLTNLLLAEQDLTEAETALFTALEATPAPVVVVSNEVGQGIVPDNALSRRFREAQGRLNIRMAARADTVIQAVAGLPNLLKGQMP